MSDWIEWNGGECPVPKGTLVDVLYRSAGIKTSVAAGGKYAHDWADDDMGRDIIAYRICEPAKQPVPDWKHAPERAQF